MITTRQEQADKDDVVLDVKESKSSSDSAVTKSKRDQEAAETRMTLALAGSYAQSELVMQGQNRAQRYLAAGYRFLDTTALTLMIFPVTEGIKFAERFAAVPLMHTLLHDIVVPTATHTKPQYPSKGKVVGRLALSGLAGSIGALISLSEDAGNFLNQPATPDNDTLNAMTQGMIAFTAVTATEQAVLHCKKIDSATLHVPAEQTLTKGQHVSKHVLKYFLNFAQTEMALGAGIFAFNPMAIVGAEVLRELVTFVVQPQPFESLLRKDQPVAQQESKPAVQESKKAVEQKKKKAKARPMLDKDMLAIRIAEAEALGVTLGELSEHEESKKENSQQEEHIEQERQPEPESPSRSESEKIEMEMPAFLDGQHAGKQQARQSVSQPPAADNEPLGDLVPGRRATVSADHGNVVEIVMAASEQKPLAPLAKGLAERASDVCKTGLQIGKNVLRNTRFVAITVGVTGSYIFTEIMCSSLADGCSSTANKIADRAVKSAGALATYFVARSAMQRFFKPRCAQPQAVDNPAPAVEAVSPRKNGRG